MPYQDDANVRVLVVVGKGLVVVSLQLGNTETSACSDSQSNRGPILVAEVAVDITKSPQIISIQDNVAHVFTIIYCQSHQIAPSNG